MALDPDLLAEEIKIALGYEDEDTSDESKGFARAIVEELKENGLVMFISGTITGTAPTSGGALQDGAGLDGQIQGLDADSLGSRIVDKVGYPNKTSQVTGFATGLINHITSSGKVVFDAGDINGTCTNTGSSSGVLNSGTGVKGQITNLKAEKLADLTGPPIGGFTSDELLDFCRALIDHLQTRAEIEFASGDVQAACPSGGGPITLGAASNGKIL